MLNKQNNHQICPSSSSSSTSSTVMSHRRFFSVNQILMLIPPVLFLSDQQNTVHVYFMHLESARIIGLDGLILGFIGLFTLLG